ncbi:MAG: cyclic nucleotide-binding domain-containing protein [Deltaproteobacteria bacterium]|nr:cyclic nucleotide-binding domain-containing protein [Deltaproteobacteria bacterium]
MMTSLKQCDKEIFDTITQTPVFAPLPEKELWNMCLHMTREQYGKGFILCRQDETALDKVYIIKNGSLELYFDEEGEKLLRGTLSKKDVFGGIAILMNGGKSARTVMVQEDVTLLVIPKNIFIDICTRYQSFYTFFVETFHDRMLDKSYASIFQSSQISHFLSGIVPFSLLPEDVLKTISREFSIVHYSSGTRLFYQGKSRVEYLYIVQEGAVERYFEEGEEKTLRGVLGEGDIYGGISMLVNNGMAVRSIRILENTYFYILPKTVFLKLCGEQKVFAEYFTGAFGKNMMDKSYASIIKNETGGVDSSTQFFNLQVENIYHNDILSCSENTSIQQAAALMSDRKCSSIFIKNSEGDYTGVVTDTDLRSKVIAKGHDISTPIANIMSSPLHSVQIDAMVSEALLEMMDTNLKHLAVRDQRSKVVGIVTNRDLLTAQEQSPFFLIRELSAASGMDEIVHMQKRTPRLIRNMLNSGAKARTITKLISSISDAILNKLVGFALDELGPAPSEFVFLIVGSEGRNEQTLKTDQDNAIIYADVSKAESSAAKAYFLKFGELVCTWLDQAGYDFCKGDVMAKNPKWCQPLSLWKRYFHSWIRVSTPKDLMQSNIFFDLRGGCGNIELVDDLRLFLFESLEGWTRFFRDLTVNALGFKPPLGFFRNFVVESKGEHRHKLDIKKSMTPIVDIARIYALNNNISETNTQERLYRLYLEKVFDEETYNDLDHAYSYLMHYRLNCQVKNIVDGEKPNNYMDPNKLSRMDQTMLKEIFKRIERMQTKLSLNFTGAA